MDEPHSSTPPQPASSPMPGRPDRTQPAAFGRPVISSEDTDDGWENSWDETEDGEEEPSLEALTAAFSEVTEAAPPAKEQSPSNSKPSSPRSATTSSQTKLPSSQPKRSSARDRLADPPVHQVSPRAIIEAMLFVGNEKKGILTKEELSELIRDVEPEDVEGIVQELNAIYQREGSAFRIQSEPEGYRYVLEDTYSSVRERFYGKLREVRLSQGAIEVLALVAYHQPVSSDKVTKLRKAPSGAILRQMVRRQLLRLERGAESNKQTYYSVTPRFLQLFQLESIEDLPQAFDL
ncbi:Segregation and condensation protein B [Planctomycetales bacterium 10988]|nr:Segregation and condensation protein B [Planctomycetales bacterium 10988]